MLTSPYAPGTAVREYQEQLAAQTADTDTPAPEAIERYVLADQPANWNNVLNLGIGKHGLHMYSVQHLRDMKAWLLNPVGHKPHGGAYFTISEQLDRVGEELESRTETLASQIASEFGSFSS